MTAKKKPAPGKPESDRPEIVEPLNAALESDAAIAAEAESAAAASDTFEQASDGLPEPELDDSEASDEKEEPVAEPAPELKRLQKILAQSGIASRRHAEELITQGRVQVNGKVVTELGSKADAHRDHIRVDGKLLHGSERQRYFMLNKPKGYVTTVSDPEGRPTIMEFFSKTRERLYPVGRLDYLSEGLLLVTNDGELANKLTRAASNVEKTYLVKVSGQPSEEALDRLREGVGISKGKPGSDRVQTAPAEIRPFRPGKPAGKRGPSRPVDNPWYEVVLIEGRNRELRKMFEEIGHHVEKIRRVGYGPLVLDLEPGKIRELEPEELENLRKAAEGKYRKPKPREARKREFAARSERPASKPRWNERRPEGRDRGPGSREERRPFPRNQRSFEQRPQPGGRRPPERNQFRPAPANVPGRDPNRESSPAFRPGAARPNPRFAEDRPQRPPRRDDRESRPYAGGRENRGRSAGNRPFQQGDRPKSFGARPPRRDFGGPAPTEGRRPEAGRRFENRPPRPGGFRSRPEEGRTGSFDKKPSAAGPNRFASKTRLDIHPVDDERPGSENRPQSRNRPERTSFPPRGESRPDRSRPQSAPSGRDQQRRPSSAEPRRFDRDRKGPPRFDRPGRTQPSREPIANRPARPERRPEQRSSGPRPAGKFKGGFKGGKRNASGNKQGTARSSSGRRPGSRPGGSRPTKRRP
jgi:23S rRNA pseudouridine2605 synthase